MSMWAHHVPVDTEIAPHEIFVQEPADDSRRERVPRPRRRRSRSALAARAVLVVVLAGLGLAALGAAMLLGVAPRRFDRWLATTHRNGALLVGAGAVMAFGAISVAWLAGARRRWVAERVSILSPRAQPGRGSVRPG
jgi:hypothetical protein